MRATTRDVANYHTDAKVLDPSTFHSQESRAPAVLPACCCCAYGSNSTFLHAILFLTVPHPRYSFLPPPGVVYSFAGFPPVLLYCISWQLPALLRLPSRRY